MTEYYEYGIFNDVRQDELEDRDLWHLGQLGPTLLDETEAFEKRESINALRDEVRQEVAKSNGEIPTLEIDAVTGRSVGVVVMRRLVMKSVWNTFI